MCIGWFVVGDGDFGLFEYGCQFVQRLNPTEDKPESAPYWEARGYELVPIFVGVVKE